MLSDLAALDLVPTPVIALDRLEDGRFGYAWMNTACREYAGFDITLVAGKTAAEAFPGRVGRRLEAQQLATVRAGHPRNYTYSLRLPRGEVRIETHLVPVLNGDGTVVRLVAFMTDRTGEQVRELAEVGAETARLERDSELERYISMAAHDLRTPMRHVQVIAGMLRDDFVDHGDGKLELIGMLEQLGESGASLIADVLAYAKATSTPSNARRFSLGPLCTDLFTVLDPTGQHDLTGDTGEFMADDVALQIVLRNLVDNSLKHGDQGRISLRLTFEGVEEGFLEFSVRDDGPGFSDPAVAFLDSGDFRYGTGFGLLGIRRLVHARGGDIWAEEPEAGTGARVRFTLPGELIGEDAVDQKLRAAG